MSGLTKAYEDALNKMQDKVDKAIDDACHLNKYVIYSAYDYDEWDNPSDNLNEVPIKGKVVFFNSYETFDSGVYENPTWLDIAVIANRMIIETKDYHHVYLEAVDVFDADGNENLMAKLVMGS